MLSLRTHNALISLSPRFTLWINKLRERGDRYNQSVQCYSLSHTAMGSNGRYTTTHTSTGDA